MSDVRPGSHAAHAPSVEPPVFSFAVPAGHGVHVVADDAPRTVEYVPVGHSAHSDCALEVWNLPASHCAHSKTPTPPDALNVPGLHAVHVDVPAGELAGKEDPALQEMGSHCVAPASLQEPRSHEVHPTFAEPAPATTPNVPAL